MSVPFSRTQPDSTGTHRNTTFALQVHRFAEKWIDHRLKRLKWAILFALTSRQKAALLFEQTVLRETKKRMERREQSLGEGSRKRQILEMQAEVRTGAAVKPLNPFPEETFEEAMLRVVPPADGLRHADQG